MADWTAWGGILMHRMFVVLATALLLLAAALNAPVQAEDVIIWYLPHPDDETLGMADSIYQSVLAGNSNFFIYFTKGTSSLARFNLRGPDGSVYRLSKSEFGRARAAETLAALAVLGVAPDQVVFLDYPDGRIPQADVEAIMRLFAVRYPGSIHRTVHIKDTHPDHQTLARALATVAQEEGIDIRPEYYHVYLHRSGLPLEQVGRKPVLHPQIRALALAEFGRWDPENNRYGIGMRSTRDLFEAVSISFYEYVDTEIPVPTLQRIPVSAQIVLSNLNFGGALGLGDRIVVESSLDLSTSALELGLGCRFKSNLPMTEIAVGGGYHFDHQKPIASVRAEVMDYFTITIKHLFQTGTRLGLGIAVQLF